MWIQAVAIILPRVQQHFSGTFLLPLSSFGYECPYPSVLPTPTLCSRPSDTTIPTRFLRLLIYFEHFKFVPQSHLISAPVQDRYIGLLSSSMFGGMMFGAVGWGTCR